MAEDEYSNQSLHILSETIARDVAEIKAQCKLTNGRVGRLEIWRGFITGGIAVIGALLIPLILKTFF